MIICTFLHRKNPHMPSKKGQITFFHFDFHFFSATSYLMRSHPACWVTSDENSAAIPLTHCSALLNVAVATRGLHYRICVCRGKKRSEEHTSELQSQWSISYAVFCW